jgi:hypothetical protein
MVELGGKNPLNYCQENPLQNNPILRASKVIELEGEIMPARVGRERYPWGGHD